MKEESFSLSTFTVSAILGLIDAQEIAVPEIQRPFVWSKSKVRNLIDSLYRGYPTGYLITWKNHNVRLKNGTVSAGKTILIDGQQRVTALMASLLGLTIVDEDYNQTRIKIAFNPENAVLMDKDPTLELPIFEVQDSSHIKSKKWIEDISVVFTNDFNQYSFIVKYTDENPDLSPNDLSNALSNLQQIKNRQIGVIEVKSSLDIDVVTDIFIRINSKGSVLSQGDFVMSKIASDETHGGVLLRKAIDYFAHLSRNHEFFSQIGKDFEFANSIFYNKLKWLQNSNEDIYLPDCDDIIRVAFMLKFNRAKLKDLVSLLSGRNFETKEYESNIIDDTYIKLQEGILAAINQNNFNGFMLAIRGAGFISSKLINSQMALDFAYTLYLTLKEKGISPNLITPIVQRWYVLSVLTGRYTSSPESVFYQDIKKIFEVGVEKALEDFEIRTISDNFWNNALPQNLGYSSSINPTYLVYLAAQIQTNNVSLLSNNVLVKDLLLLMGDVHHIFPKDYLKKNGFEKKMYNQVANYAYLDNSVNKSIGNKAPNVYFKQAIGQCATNELVCGSIKELKVLKENLKQNCIPEGIENMDCESYEKFLEDRRLLMAYKVKEYYLGL